ncbi:DUF4245 domain-containing protein [Streptomyces boninensis]|uniref:DUF4245 domain-containing protein n=1 Tax=Streptomyces boninensis TaxID=2039455 RepID=UPI003B227252
MASERARKQTVRNLLLSLAVSCLVAFAFYLLLVPKGEGRDAGDAVGTISYTQELGQAKRVSPYPVVVPQGLGKEWRPTSVTFRKEGEDYGTTWHLGFLTPDDEYVGVEQADEKPVPFIEDKTHGARETDRAAERLGGRDWKVYDGPERDGLVHQEDGVTTVVSGTAPMKDLKKMAAALEPQKKD